MVEERIGIGADRVEGDIAEIEQTGHADDDIQAQAEHDIHQGGRHDIGLVGRGELRKGDGHGQQQRDQRILLLRRCQDAVDDRFLFLFRLFLDGSVSGPVLHDDLDHAIDHKGPDRDIDRIFPAPTDDSLNWIDLDDHERKGQEDEPQRDEQAVFYLFETQHVCHRLRLSWFPPCPAGRTA